MRVLILGSGSFAGQAVFSSLLRKDINVIGINRSKPKGSFYWEWLKEYSDNKFQWITCNLYKEPQKMKALIKDISPTHIIDFMGQGMVSQSWEDPRLWFQTNISEKSFLLEEIRKINNLKKYIRISTPEVYGSSFNPLDESANFNPSTPYAISHAAIDQYIRCIGKNYNFPYLIGRFGNFYGPGQQLYRVIPKAIISIYKKINFTLDGGGKSKRSFIYSSDFVCALEKCLFTEDVYGEFNFNSNEEVSIKQLLKMICKMNYVDFEEFVKLGPERPGKDLYYRMNCNKSEQILNWTTQTTLEEGLTIVSNWIKKNYSELSKEDLMYIHKE